MNPQQVCSHCGTPLLAHARFCNRCGAQCSPAVHVSDYQASAPGAASGLARYAAPPGSCLLKPGKVQAIAIMCLVDGILNLLWGIGLITTICGAPLGIYAFVLGVLEIIFATKMLPDPIRAGKPNKTLAYMQIANIITGDVISLTIGIISLVFYNEPPVQHYFDTVAAQFPVTEA